MSFSAAYFVRGRRSTKFLQGDYRRKEPGEMRPGSNISPAGETDKGEFPLVTEEFPHGAIGWLAPLLHLERYRRVLPTSRRFWLDGLLRGQWLSLLRPISDCRHDPGRG